MQSATSNDAPGRVRKIVIDSAHDGQRIDNCVVTLLKGVPRSVVYRLLRTGQIRVNGRRAKPSTRLAEGDELRLPPVRMAERSHVAPPSGQVSDLTDRIIFEDKHFLVIDKPSGVASHGGSGIRFGVIELLRAARPDAYLELAHRLDRDTSGVLVLARSRKALVALQALIREGAVTKQYLALLQGQPDKPKFDVNVPLRKFVKRGGERMVQVATDGKPALTFFKQVERYPRASLMTVTLGTGRTHQIRVHAAHVGHPVAGDDKYGDRDADKRLHRRGLHRLFLHAARFEFEWGERSYAFSAPLPDDLRSFLDTLGG